MFRMGGIRESGVQAAPPTFPGFGKAGGLLAPGMSRRLMFAEQVDAAGRCQRVGIIRTERLPELGAGTGLVPVPCVSPQILGSVLGPS